MEDVVADQAASEAVKRAVQSLKAGQFKVAFELLAPLDHPSLNDVNFLKLYAETATRAGQLTEAESALARLNQQQPLIPELVAAQGDILRQLGQFDRALPLLQQSLELAPRRPEFLYNAGLCLLALNRFDAAEELFRLALDIRADYQKAALGLANALEGKLDLVGAERVLVSMLVDQSANPAVWFRLARLYDQMAQDENFDRALENLSRLRPKDPKIYLALARLLLTRGRPDEAENWAVNGLQQRRDDVELLGFLANFRRERGEGDFLKDYEAVGLAELADSALADYVRFLSLASRGDEARSVLMQLKGPPGANWSEALVLAMLELQRGAGQFREMLELIAGRVEPSLSEWATIAYLGLGQFEAAGHRIDQLLANNPHHQYWLALKGVVTKALYPEEYASAFDPKQQTQTVNISDALSGAEMFKLNTLLEGWLAGQHFFVEAPLGQSVVGGTQSPGNLFNHHYPPLQRLKKVLLDEIRQLLNGPDAARFGDRVLQRWSGHLTIESAWSICVRESGFHVPHVHSKGWLSCVYYVAVPEHLQDTSTPSEGALALGRPGVKLPAEVAPALVVPARPGQLVVFPSYTWHETTPFSGQGNRVVIAFDLLPIAK